MSEEKAQQETGAKPMVDTSHACEICRNRAGNLVHIAREMMFGFRDQFRYLECGGCGCLRLLDVPSDMAHYYPKNYYSFEEHGAFKTALRRRWSAHAFGSRSLFGWMFAQLYFPNQALVALRRLPIDSKSRILDVGCGSGHLLLDLKHLGFQNLTGADAFIEHDLDYGGGLIIHKKHLQEMSGEYDVIMLHHSFEHMDAPLDKLRSIERLLARNGSAILRLPVASSYAWKRFGVNWVQLDAPRHLFLHTQTSIGLLAKQAGLIVSEVTQEADDGTLWASPAYEQDIPMSDPRFPNSSLSKRVRGWPNIRRCRLRAREINRRNEADLVCFYLKRSGS